jgi:hypothetical protein
VKSTAVKIREVRAISRKDQGELLWNPQRPYAGPAELRGMIWSGLHGDMQSAAEMTAPPRWWEQQCKRS